MVHKYDETLEYLLNQLDSKNVDVFMHVDAKCKNFPFEIASTRMKKANPLFYLK